MHGSLGGQSFDPDSTLIDFAPLERPRGALFCGPRRHESSLPGGGLPCRRDSGVVPGACSACRSRRQRRDVDAQYADMAKRMHITADELTRTLGQGGVDAKTLRAKFLADLGWRYVIRGRFGWGAAGQRAKGQRAKRQRRSGESEERQYASNTTIRHGRFCSRCRPATQPCWRRTRRMRRGCVPVHRL
jgi:hypothetical protein